MDAKGTRDNIRVIDSMEKGGMKVEVLEYQNLMGSNDISVSQKLYFMKEQNMRVRQIAVYLDNDTCKIEPGAMSYFQGNLEMLSGLTKGNFLGRAISGKLTGENLAQPEYKGTGMLVLEPTFRHVILIKINEGESAIVDKGMFYGAQGSVSVKAKMQDNISSGMLGREGLFQIELTGPGIAILECDVPYSEIDVVKLDNDTLKVDGNFAVMRTGNIQFSVERYEKTLMGTAVSGEGLVSVFRGTGKVWLAPTLKVYDTLSKGHNKLNNMDMNTSDSTVHK